MEAKIKCPNCNRCIGCIVSTNSKNGILKTMLDLPKKLNEKENVFHTTCQRCKKEIYILIGFKN